MNSSVDIALAWWFHPDSGVFEHGGSLLGFTADTFFNPNDDVAVIVLSNVGPGTAVSAETIGEHIRARLDGKPAVSLAAVVDSADRRCARRAQAARRLLDHDDRRRACSSFGLAMTVQGARGRAPPTTLFPARVLVAAIGDVLSRRRHVFSSADGDQAGGPSRGAERRRVLRVTVTLVPRPVAGTQWIAGACASGARVRGSGWVWSSSAPRSCTCSRTSARFARSRSNRTLRPRRPRCFRCRRLGTSGSDRGRAVQRQDVVPQRSASNDSGVLLGRRVSPSRSSS